MFQYALGTHLALKNRTELLVDTTFYEHVPKNGKYFVKREYDLDVFDIDVRKLEPRKMNRLPYYSNKPIHKLKHSAKRHLNLYKYLDRCPVVNETKYFSFDENVLECGSNAYLIGHWQNEK